MGQRLRIEHVMGGVKGYRAGVKVRTGVELGVGLML